MFFYLAIRNITRNLKSSFLIALLISIITFLFFIGNSVIRQADTSIRQAFIENLTGDVVIQRKDEITMNLFTANTPVIETYFDVPVLPAYDIVKELIAREEGIVAITSQVSGRAHLGIMSVGEAALLCGIDASTYFSLFPGITLEEGRFLQTGELGGMITRERAGRIEERTGQRPSIGTPLVLTSVGDMGFKIREVPLVGIFSYQNTNRFLNEIVIVDPQTVRVLNAIQVATGSDVEVSEDLLRLFDTDLFDLFSEDYSDDDSEEEAGFSADMLRDFLFFSPIEEYQESTDGDWNFIIISLERGMSAARFISSINRKLEQYDLVAVNWRIAAGGSAIVLLLVQALFNAGLFLVSIVGVITVINILLIAVFRRTREIGTLKAIGTSDARIRSLVYCENLVLAVIAGSAGLAGGFFLMQWINGLRLTIGNEIIASLMGGPVLYLEFMPLIAVFSFITAVVLGIVASVYPVEAAVRIEPMAAVRRG